MKKFFIVLMTTAILFPLSASSAIQGDINNDGRIDTSEAIYALQVAAGLYPGVSTSCLLSGKGDWSTSTVYRECDVVSFGGENYVCNEPEPHTSSASAFGDDSENWDLLSLKGDTGATGPQGPPGEDGTPGTSEWADGSGIVTTNSKVGLGTTSPGLGLQVSNYVKNYPANSGTVQNGGVRINANDGDGTMDFGTVSGGNGWIQMTDTSNLASNYSLLLNPNGGNVGIGTLSPNEALEVGGSGRIFIGDGGGANRTGLLIDANEVGNHVRLAPYDYENAISMDLYIASKVGIGTTLPYTDLHISDTVEGLDYALKIENRYGGTTSGTSATGILFSSGGSGGNERGKGALIYDTTGFWNKGAFHFLQNTSDNNSNPTLGGSVMTIDNSGNVGIGTTSPGSKLHINGTVKTSGDFKYTSERTFYLGVPACAFQKNEDFDLNYGANWCNSISGSYGYICDVQNHPSVYILAPLSLPEGVLIKNVTFYYYDNDPSGELQFGGDLNARSYTNTTDESLATVSMEGSSDSVNIQSIVMDNVGHTVNNGSRQYWLAVSWYVNSTTANDDFRFYGARVEYGATTLKP